MSIPIGDLIGQLKALTFIASHNKDAATLATLTAAIERLTVLSGTSPTAGDWFWCNDEGEGGGDSIQEAIENLAEDMAPGTYIEPVYRSHHLPRIWTAFQVAADSTVELHIFAAQADAIAKFREMGGGQQEGLGL